MLTEENFNKQMLSEAKQIPNIRAQRLLNIAGRHRDISTKYCEWLDIDTSVRH